MNILRSMLLFSFNRCLNPVKWCGKQMVEPKLETCQVIFFLIREYLISYQKYVQVKSKHTNFLVNLQGVNYSVRTQTANITQAIPGW